MALAEALKQNSVLKAFALDGGQYRDKTRIALADVLRSKISMAGGDPTILAGAVVGSGWFAWILPANQIC